MTGNEAYRSLLFELLHGEKVTTRNATVTRVVASKLRFCQTPLVTSRKTPWKTALREFEFFLAGGSNIRTMHPSVRPWWQPWTEPNGGMPNSYGLQFREFYGSYGPVDQVTRLIDGVRDHPYSRRNLITTWNTSDMVHPSTLITTCHGTIIHAVVHPKDNSLELITYQRSADVMVGLPANWFQYWALLLWLCSQTGREVGSLVWIGGDVHLYDTHRELAQRVLDAPDQTPCPQLVYQSGSTDFLADDFSLDREYIPGLVERAEMVV